MHNPLMLKTFLDKDPDFTTNSQVFQTLNTFIQDLGESSIDKRNIKSNHYATSKDKKMSSSMNWKLFVAAENSASGNHNKIDKSVLQNLKSNYLSSTRYLKIGVLER